jgi:hypothetical protein
MPFLPRPGSASDRYRSPSTATPGPEKGQATRIEQSESETAIYIKNGGWEGHGQVTLIDPQEGKYERRNVNAVIAVCIQPHNLVFIAERWL